MLPLKKDIKLVRSLHQKKFRNLNGLFLVEGLKMVEEAIRSEFVVHSLYSSNEIFCKHHSECIQVTAKEMEQMTALSSPSAHLAVLHQKHQSIANATGDTVIVLDGIADPGNLGTILRTAEWFGVQTLFCTPDCVELYNPKVVQSTMGSMFRMHVIYEELPMTVEWLKKNDFVLIGAEMNGTNHFDFVYPSKTALVIGSESHGISENMKQYLNTSITIQGKGQAESLNASIATSILLAESFRQRR